jgi:purine catabolism regulator
MITVAGLVAVRSLGLSYLAGAEGGGRPITWAHTCDVPEPWYWVGPGDLVMTTGGGLPADPGEQVDWLTSLASTRACGLMIGARPGTPEVSAAMRDTADELRFPLLDADFELEFASVAHIVIENVLRSERERIVEIRRLYDAYGQALRTRAELPERLRVVAGNLGWELELRDAPSGQVLAASAEAPLDADTESARSVPIPGARSAVLAAVPVRRPVLDTLVLHHLAGLVGVELEQRAAERDRRRRLGAALLGELLAGRLSLDVVRPELEQRGLTGSIVLARLAAPGQAEALAALHHTMVLAACHPLLRPCEDGGLLALLPAEPDLVRALVDELGPDAAAGVSAPLTPVPGVTEAARQAGLALGHAISGGSTVADYPRLSELPDLLPASLERARALVARHLGPLSSHDRANGTELVATLRMFLRHDGSWQATAKELGVHRQTLVYRLRTVARLTGLKPTSSEGTATLWLALRAADQAELLSEPLKPSDRDADGR